MKQPHFLPILNKDFCISRVIENKQLRDWLKKHNKSMQNVTELVEPLYELHSHDYFEILIVLDGECEFICEGTTSSLSKGDVVMVPPYAVHRAIIKRLDQYRRIVVNISQDLISDFKDSSPTLKENINHHKKQSSYLLYLHPKNYLDMISLLDEITEKMESGKEYSSFSLQYRLFKVLDIILDPTSTPALSETVAVDQRLASILKYIEVHFKDPDLNLENVADYFNLSKFYFSHYFKEKVNLSFYRYVTIKRLSLSMTMIKQNRLSIEQIALKCGYIDYSSFYRAFKKEYKVSPKKLQKEYVTKN